MRTYGKVHLTFWTNTGMVRLSHRAKLVALFLLTGPHSNSIGCFRMPPSYLVEDLAFGHDEAADALDELVHTGFIVRCPATGWTLIRNYLRFNPPENGKVAKNMMSLVEAVPRDAKVWKGLVESVDAVQKRDARFPAEYVKGLLASLDTVSANSGNGIPQIVGNGIRQSRETVSMVSTRNPGTPEPEPEPVLSQEEGGGLGFFGGDRAPLGEGVAP